LLKKQKKFKLSMSILFTSLWDKHSLKLVELLKRQSTLNFMSEKKTQTPLYITNSFLMPHSFVIFKSFRIPHLVHLFKDTVRSEYYLPKIYEELGL
jgi:hypothetical protein